MRAAHSKVLAGTAHAVAVVRVAVGSDGKQIAANGRVTEASTEIMVASGIAQRLAKKVSQPH